jgi:hypothetical protein
MEPETRVEATTGLLSEALRVGLVGAFAVALWFLAVDLMAGREFYTPGALGSAVFLGASSPADVVVNVTTVGLYTLLHGGVFVLVGLALAALFQTADRAPSMVAGILLLTVVLEVLFVAAVAIVAQFLLGQLAWWAVLGGNIVASLAMGGMLLRAHPRTAARLSGSDPIPAP